MSYLTIDDVFCDHLRGILETVELRDTSGKLLGHFTPFVSAEERAMYEKAKTLFDPAEVERRLREEAGKGAPLQEVLRRIQSKEIPR
jgi:hypothetical protein